MGSFPLCKTHDSAFPRQGCNGCPVGTDTDPLRVLPTRRYYPDPRAPVKLATAEDLLAQAEKGADGDLVADIADAKDVRRLVANLEKRLEANMTLRAKYHDDPGRFMDSEIALDAEIRRTHAIASAPDLFIDFCEAGGHLLVTRLLGHENGDIAGDAASLLREMTDADSGGVAGGEEGSREDAMILTVALVEADGLEALVARLGTFDERVEEEAQGVQNALSAVENMLDVYPAVAGELLRRTELLPWLLGRIRPKQFDPNQQLACEILAVLLQDSDAAREKAGEVGGVLATLKAISSYRKEDPRSEDELEYMLNLFDCACSLLMLPANRARFLEAEGLELMLLILRTKRKAGFGAFKAIDFTLAQQPAACERFVRIFGLKALFGAFMGRAKVLREKGSEGERQARELTARAVSILSHLFSLLPPGSAERERLCAKFVENEFEKCDRLVELLVAGLGGGDAGLGGEAGPLALQQLCTVFGHLFGVGDAALRRHLTKLLHQNKLPLQTIRATLAAMHADLGDADGAEQQAEGRRRIVVLLRGLGADAEMMARLGEAGPAAAVGGAAAAAAGTGNKDEGMVEPAGAGEARQEVRGEMGGAGGERERERGSTGRGRSRDREDAGRVHRGSSRDREESRRYDGDRRRERSRSRDRGRRERSRSRDRGVERRRSRDR